MTPTLKGFDHFVLTVRDIDTTVAFYTTVLGMLAEVFTPDDGSTRTALKFGAQKINLHQAGGEFEPKAYAATMGSADFCIISDAAINEWQEHFQTLNIKIIDGPILRTGAIGKIISLYLRDPDGNLIEISNYL